MDFDNMRYIKTMKEEHDLINHENALLIALEVMRYYIASKYNIRELACNAEDEESYRSSCKTSRNHIDDLLFSLVTNIILYGNEDGFMRKLRQMKQPTWDDAYVRIIQETFHEAEKNLDNLI